MRGSDNSLNVYRSSDTELLQQIALHVAATNRIVFTGDFSLKSLSQQHNFVAATSRTSIRVSLFSKDVKVEQSFDSSGSLFHKLAALNKNERCPYDCLILGNFKFLLLFRVSLEWTVLNLNYKTSLRCSCAADHFMP